MALSLNGTLKTAQDGDNHRPIAQIVSSPMGEIIPTHGNYYNTITTAESEPTIITQSTGRLGVVMERNTAIKYLYTPTDRSEFIEVGVEIPYATAGQDPCLVELTGGNIGIIYTVNQTNIYYNIVTPTGTVVSGPTLIYNAGTNWVANPYVILLANTNYLLVYPEGTGVPPDDAETYYLQQRISSNFTSWGSATDITPSSFTANRYCNNPHLVQVTSGRIFLHLDYLTQYTNAVELNNIYMIYSDNNGTSWSAAEKITNYTALGESAVHPTAIEDDTGDLIFMYPEKSLVKVLDKDMTGYPYTEINPGGRINFSAERNQIEWWIPGDSYPPMNLTTINVDSWEWERTLDSGTIPALPNIIMGPSDCEWLGFVVPISGYAAELYSLNSITEATNYYKWGYTAGGSVTYLLTMECGYAENAVKAATVATHGGVRKLFALHQCSGYGSHDANLGWFDCDALKDPITGLYEWNQIWDYDDQGTKLRITGSVLYYGNHKFDYVHNWFCAYVWGSSQYVPNPGLTCWDTDGVIRFEGGPTTISGWPKGGCRDFLFVGYDVYFSFQYNTSDPEKRGLGHYRASTGTVTLHQPNWATVNEYDLRGFTDMGDGRILMTSNNTLANGGGVVIFDTATHSWQIINDDTYPGFGRTGANWNQTAYDPATKTIYAVYDRTLIAFSEYGPYSTLIQTEIDNVDSTIDYGDYITWSYNNFEYQPSITLDPDNILWGTWQHLEDGTEYSAQWANLLDDVDLSDDIEIKSPISITWDIEKPAQLQLSLARGHLYDPQNYMSTLSPFLRKGRKIKMQFGETVATVDYWQNQGEFCVKAVALEYSSKKYPTAKLTAEDFRILWEDHEVIATMFYENETPYNVLENILVQQGSMDAAELDIPDPFENEHTIQHQWVEMTLEDIVKEILDHYEYYPFVTVDGVFKPRYLNLDKSVNHTYSDNVQMVKYTPNDKYSTFINRITVKGMSKDYYEVLYGEESITTLTGTAGFWGGREYFDVWFSDDRVKTYRYPRMEVIQSVDNFQIFGIRFGGGYEEISYVDPTEHYITIYIKEPDLLPALIGAILGVLITGTAALTCGWAGGSCGYYIFAITIFLNIAMYILGAVASYHYVIWGRPIGHEKRSFQATANDYAFQDELGGKIITTTIDDPLCYTIAECQRVANFELEVVKAQRRRLKFYKTAHLQDEIGDKIVMTHPYSNEALTILVANLKRTMKVGKEFIDEIEGWRIS